LNNSDAESLNSHVNLEYSSCDKGGSQNSTRVREDIYIHPDDPNY
jgi:hypothetical protein